MSQAPKVPTPHSSTQEAVKERATKIYRYLVRGISATDIGKIEGIRLGQVYWYIQEGGRILGGELKLLTERGVLRELFLHHQERKRQLWQTYQSTKLDIVKVSCLKQLAEEDDRMLDLAERLQLIEQKALKIDGQMSWVDLILAAQRQRANGDGHQRGSGLGAPASLSN